MDYSKLTKSQKEIVTKALNHLGQAGMILCCANSPFGSVKDQDKVFAIIKECRDKIMNIK